LAARHSSVSGTSRRTHNTSRAGRDSTLMRRDRHVVASHQLGQDIARLRTSYAGIGRAIVGCLWVAIQSIQQLSSVMGVSITCFGRTDRRAQGDRPALRSADANYGESVALGLTACRRFRGRLSGPVQVEVLR
jgi:hypothetical protein